MSGKISMTMNHIDVGANKAAVSQRFGLLSSLIVFRH
jgi:hypothetical protein